MSNDAVSRIDQCFPTDLNDEQTPTNTAAPCQNVATNAGARQSARMTRSVSCGMPFLVSYLLTVPGEDSPFPHCVFRKVTDGATIMAIQPTGKFHEWDGDEVQGEGWDSTDWGPLNAFPYID
jgi:hypothetical protein